jgi:hypothetical protein
LKAARRFSMTRKHAARTPAFSCVVLFLGAFLIICALASPAQKVAGAKPIGSEINSNQPVNLVVLVEGPVNLKRQGWSVYAPLAFGTTVHIGDLLRVNEGSRSQVVCSDLTLREVPTGISAVPCSAARVVLKGKDGSKIMATRGWPSDGSFPVVLSPRKTKLISTHPTLRWTGVKGATAYTVVVRGGDLYWSTVVTSATEVVYPQKAPQLEVGVNYKLLVVANDGRPYDEPGLGLGFSLLPSQDKKAVLQEQKQIESLGLSEGPTQFLIAHLYADHGLYAEAIERLEGVSQKFKMAAVERLLGDLHMDIGLPRQAEADYLTSLDLSKAENDDEAQMLLHQVLAYLYGHTLGNKGMASQHLNAMLDLARKLGDDSAANQAGKQLAELKTASPTE